MLQKRSAEVVSKLKKVKDEEGLSCQRIVELVEQNGDFVSLSTVKRVFEEGSETFGFQYENTLRPIAEALLGIRGPAAAASADEADALRAIIDYKSEKIADLEARLARCEESYQRRLAFIKDQIALKDARIDRLHGIIERMVDALLPESPRGGVPHVHAVGTETGGGLDLPPEIPHG